MKLIINGITNDVPNISGTKLDTMKALAPKLENNIAEKVIKLNRLDKSEFSQISRQIANSFGYQQKTYELNGEKVVEIDYKPKANEPDVEANARMHRIDDAKSRAFSFHSETSAELHNILNTEFRDVSLSFAQQKQIQAAYWNTIYSEMQKKDIDMFRASINSDNIINRIRDGGAWEIGDFSMDDWFDVMGKDWGAWLDSDVSTETRAYLRNEAGKRGLLEEQKPFMREELRRAIEEKEK